LTGSWQKPT